MKLTARQLRGLIREEHRKVLREKKKQVLGGMFSDIGIGIKGHPFGGPRSKEGDRIWRHDDRREGSISKKSYEEIVGVIERMPLTNAHRSPLDRALNHYASVVYFSNEYSSNDRKKALDGFVSAVKKAMDVDCDWKTKKSCQKKKAALKAAAANLLGKNMDGADRGALHSMHVHLEALSKKKNGKGFSRTTRGA
jgi:ribosomal protein L22